MKRRRFTFFLMTLTTLVLKTAYGGDSPRIEFEKFVLKNGLQVILHEDHSTPIVSINVWYHVGSKNEKRGRTGFAHLFEHLMFEGSENVPEGMFDKWLEGAGGDNNGSTTEDRTNYWENIPSNALELALYLEGDRMANLLPAIDKETLDGQRDIVKNERRQGVDNRPYGRVSEIQLEALYPYNHPYSWPVIGSLEDLSAASVEDVKEFFKQYYAPNNASLCIAGDIDPEETRKLVEKHFGNIPPGPPLERFDSWVPSLETTKTIDMKDNVSLPRIYMGWHTPALYAPGDSDLDMLASLLADGKNSRLYKSLVYEKQIAQDVTAYQASREISGTFHIVATAKPGIALEDLQNAIDEELKRLQKEGPTKLEVETAVNAWEASYQRSLESVGGFGGKADRLNQYNVFAGRPDYFAEEIDRYRAVTPTSVSAVNNEFLGLDRRVVIRVTPHGDIQADSTIKVDRTVKPVPGPTPKLQVPDFEERTLSNDLRVLVVEQHEVPVVEFNLVTQGGWAADPVGKPGVSSLASDLQDEGTKSRNALKIAQDLKSLGARLNTSSSFDDSSVTLNCLTKHVRKALEIFSDVVVNPTFEEEELDRKRKEYLARILQEERQPFTSGIKSFLRILYGNDHPYGQPYTGTGTEESISAIKRTDLQDYYQTFARPNNSTLIVVGDITAESLLPLLEEALGGWEPRDVPSIHIPSVEKLDTSKVYLIDKPGAAQSVILAGHLGLMRDSADYYGARVVNTMLGGKFTSRLNMNLREDKGYSYGAISQFTYRKGLGAFFAATQVHTEFTGESLAEMVKEMVGLRGDIPVSDEELKDTKRYITLRYPREFETTSQVATKLDELVTYNLPRNYFNQFVASIDAVDSETVKRVATQNVRPEKMLFVVVGDIEKIESGIKALELGKIHYLDQKGNPLNR